MAFVKNREQFLSKSAMLYQMVIFSTFDSDRKYAIRIGLNFFKGTWYFLLQIRIVREKIRNFCIKHFF